ncbi:MAG: alpha/beta fold hydrolase [Nitrospira sp.]|nr:alpha/beta fold hydrolase [Nitrospira sp.]
MQAFLRIIVGGIFCMLAASCTTPDTLPLWFDAVEHLPVNSITVNGQRVAYLDRGTGPAVVLIHGFGGSMWQWEHQQAALAQHFRVITPDLPGSGLSDKPDIAYTPEEMLQFLVGFLDALQIPQASLAGNSMGAGLAIGMALDHPDRVSKLVLISGLPPQVMEHLTNPSIKHALTTNTPSWLVSFGNWLFGSLMVDKILKEIVYDHTLLTPAVLERSNRNRQRPGLIKPLMTVGDNLPAWEERYAPRIKTITHPTLILWGEEDRVFPIQTGRLLHDLILKSTFAGIPRAGHIPQWEQPELVNAQLQSFLQP